MKDNRRATLLLRSRLTMPGNVNVPLEVLHRTELEVTCVDDENTSSSKTFRDLKLLNDRETAVTVVVPPNVRSVSFTLHAWLKRMSDRTEESMSSSHTVRVSIFTVRSFCGISFLRRSTAWMRRPEPLHAIQKSMSSQGIRFSSWAKQVSVVDNVALHLAAPLTLYCRGEQVKLWLVARLMSNCTTH